MTSHTPSPDEPVGFTGWLSLAQLVSWGSAFYSFSMLLVPVEQALGLSRSDASAAFSLALLAEGAAAFAVGRWIDRGHERWVMTAGSALCGACLAGLSQVQTGWAWTLLWGVLGLGLAATLYTPAFAVLTRRFPTQFRRQIITLTFLGGLASTVFIPLMAWLLSNLGWRHMLWVLACCHWFICLPIHWWVLRPADPRPTARQSTWTPSATPSPVSPTAPQAPTALHDYRHAMRQPPFWLVGVFTVLGMSVTVAVAAHLVNLLAESGLPREWAVLLPASIGVVQVVGRSGLFVLEHRVSVHTVNRWIPALMPVSLLILLGALAVLPWSASAAALAAMAFAALYGLGNGMLTIVKGTAIAQYVSHRHAASLNGALGLPTALGRASAPWLLGVLWSPTSGYTYGLVLLLTLSLAAWMALLGAQRWALMHKI